jgi:fatty-acyl-CoA synthase
MYPGTYAEKAPDRAAVINAVTGAQLTYKELDDHSNQLAQFLFAQGLRRGDHIAMFLENDMRFFEVAWAAFRSGLYITAINRYLTDEEAAYIVNDCEAQAIVTSFARADVAKELPPLIPNCPHRLMMGGVINGWESYEEALDAQPAEQLAKQPRGDTMLYSSGTTGRPKGVKRPLTDTTVEEGSRLLESLRDVYGFNEQTIYLSPAPLYHAAPFAYTLGTHVLGGTVVMMEKFDPVESLKFIEKYKITHSQWVPTMFIRMLKLAPSERTGFDLSSHACAIHAAAPCPVEIKKQMIEWWGPILREYYAGTEGNGSTVINSEDWLAHPGSVGRSSTAIIHICDEAGNDLPAGEPGAIFFEQEVMAFEYYNAPEKTKEATHPIHPNWSTLGDVGYLDEDGFLYLTDRKAFMIISGGVNIYPQEIEDALVLHPKVADVAVFGVPNEDMGEEVKAVVQLAVGLNGDDALEAELMGFAREKLANYMAPRSIDFIDELPRLPTGKLYKRILRDKYWGKMDSKIV